MILRNFTRTSFGLFLAFLITNTAYSAGLPPLARSILNQLPGKKVSLEVILTLGVTSSDQYKLITSENITKDTARWDAEAFLDSKITASSGIMDGVLKPTGNPDLQGDPKAQSVSRLGFNYSKMFKTGTSLEAGYEIIDGYTEVESDTTFGGNQVIDNVEHKSTITVRQQLWKNAFGRSLQEGIEAGRFQGNAVELSVQNQVDEFTLKLVEVYYNVWLAQAKVFADQARLARQRRLLKITKIQQARGNADLANVLQIKSAMGFSKELLGDSELQLGDIWRNMVTVLKLPLELLHADPKLIPMAIDSKYSLGLDLCRANPDPVKAIVNAPQLKQAELLKEAADLQFNSEKRQLNPQLAFEFKMETNGVSGTAEWDKSGVPKERPYDSSVSDALAIGGGTSRSTFGIFFEMPLEDTEGQASMSRAFKSQLQAETSLSKVRGDLAVRWMNSCKALSRSVEKVDAMIQIYKDQLKRSKLEQKRFRLARVSALEVISAGNDVTDSEMAVASARRDLRVNGWRVIQLHGDMKEQLEEIQKKDIKVSY